MTELYLYGKNAGACIDELSLLNNLKKVSVEGYYTDKNGILYSSDNTQIIFVPMGAEGRIELEDTIQSIGADSFASRSKFESLVIPASVRQIDLAAFTGCSSLFEIIVDDQNNSYTANEGILYNKAFTEILYVPLNIQGKVSIVEGVTQIGLGCFKDRTGVTEIFIPDSVISIGVSAFVGCTQLTSMKIPDNVKTIGAAIFSGCYNLTELTLPFVGYKEVDNLLDQDSYPFGYIFGETYYYGSVAVKQTVRPPYVVRTYYVPQSLNKVTITGGKILRDAFANCNMISSIILQKGITNIGMDAFASCTSLTSIEIPNSVISIDFTAFYNCSSLTSITIPNSVTSIESGAFSGCSSLTSVIFENTSGWWYADSSTATSGTKISESDLANHFTAATYLTSNYVWHYWKRS